ncbi:MAG: hypothetical protein Q9194_007357 [Teloschistes cf. exilis]
MATASSIGFAIPNFDWDAYTRLRPAYPSAIFSRIYDYHQHHCDRWETIHDAGSGAGTAAQKLAERFTKVIVSDPNPEYLNAARMRLRKSERSVGEFFFHESTAENQSWLDGESLDMFTMFTSIGYAPLDKLMPEMGRVLRPGGTFAAVNYNGWPAICDNLAAAEAWMEIADLWVSQTMLNGHEAAQRGMRVTWAGHDCIGLPEDFFKKGVVRVKINEHCRPEADQVQRLPELGFPSSKVLDTDVIIDENNVKDWTKEFSLAELKMYVGTLAYIPQGSEVAHLWQRIEEAMQAANHRRLQIRWTAHITLATRR